MEESGVQRAGNGQGGSGAAPVPLFANAICAVDGHDGGFAAVEQAAALTGSGGSLTCLVVTSYRSGGEHRGPAISPLSSKRIVDRAKAIAERAGVSLTVDVEPASPPARVVLEQADAHDLLALGAPKASWLGGMLIAGVADAALASFITPLLAARAGDGPQGSGGHGTFERVIVASDGLEDSERAVALAGSIARSHGSRLTLLHATGHLHGDDHRRITEQAHNLGLAADGGDVLLPRGGAHRAIVDSATEVGASLVVVGSRRRAGARAIGSVSRRVVHDAPCSVLLAPP
jgi:nucleotide-binding universal stress UspA family protein